jgi:PIN domain nuclease of toxin-antitoxin system
VSEGPIILDASALIAAMRGEPGAERVRAVFDAAVIGAVNLAEVVAKLQDKGVPDAVIDDALAQLALPVVAFDEAQAVRSGKLRRQTRAAGLSLGDRACLALAEALDGVALTTDRAWTNATVDARIELIR